MICPEKHTKFQPEMETLVCPKCGADREFYIDTNPIEIPSECELLHEEDFLVCDNCGSQYTGKQLAKMLTKKANLVPCPHCKGTGLIKKGET